MILRRILNLLCPIFITLCLIFGFAKIGQGVALTAGLVALGVWLLAYRWPSTWLPSIALVLTVCLAAIGLSFGASALLMLVAATLALANWDLALLNRIPTVSSSTQNFTLLEKKHYQNLLLALGLAFSAIMMGRMIRVQIPFGVMILLVTLAFFSLTRVWAMFSK
jgi:hypothetical protein